MTVEKQLGPGDLADALGLPLAQLDQRTVRLVEQAALRYRTIDPAGQRRIEAETAARIAEGFTVVGEHRANIWRDAWQDQLDRFEQAGYAIEALNPAFVAGSTTLRWQGAYVEGVTPKFELVFMEILRDWMFRAFLGDVTHLYEFGSGSAFNLAAYAGLYPDIPLTALDWAPAAVRIAELLREKRGMRITGQRFDFFADHQDLRLTRESGVLTMCALEQIGERFGPFLEYLLHERPRRVVHMEPTVELYDAASAHDRLAIDYHRQRRYLTGFLPALEALAAAGRITLRFKRRLRFGSRFHECFTVLAWEPA